MTEIEMFLNKKQAKLRKAVLCIGSAYTSCRLREFLDHTNLDELVITGYISPEQADDIMEPWLEQAAFGKQRTPAHFEYCPLDQLVRPEGEFALVCEALDENQDILPLASLAPDYLAGQVKESDFSSFAIWEVFHKTCKHILLVTKRICEEPQVLEWEKKPDTDIELSVIFPMYNVAKYLDQCIQSVTAWKAEYVEFLFVNDGSPDNSKEIVLKYAQQDKRIKLLDKPNGGCASARQWGLEHANSRYVGFVDPDDFIDESMFRKLFRAAMIGTYDISYCGHKEYYESTGESVEAIDLLGQPYNRGVTNKRQVQELIAYRRVAIWRAIYKMEMLINNGIHFYTEIRRFDDLPFFVETMAAANSIISVDEYLYYYRLERPGQDITANDERLYVHFPIFAHLNQSVAGKKDPRLTDLLQICKVGTHRYALEKIKPEMMKEYAEKARVDFAVTGTFWRTLFLVKQVCGTTHAKYYWAIMRKNYPMLRKLSRKKAISEKVSSKNNA